MAPRTPFFIAALLNAAVAVLVAIGLLLPSPAAPPAAGPSASTTPATPSQEAPTEEHSEETVPAPEIGDALTALNSLEVKGRAPKTGYEREEFGQAWSDDVTVDFGHNGCDTRNDILRRDLDSESLVLKEGTHDCVVLSGTLHDPYSGQDIEFQRGAQTSRAVQIDHVVALADAWQKGAQQWSPEKRRNFANDPLNLLAVDGPLNQQKGAGDAATWLPPNKGFRCEYARRIVEVKAVYEIWVTEAEQDALSRLLHAC
ncbi:HNH endonuclease family protein [Corynebacterium sp. HMSC074H12]|uniref:HNH endonuclease family protein n=1 Tax=Corynebacterium sp. HMSC074H12 TaxID=1739436 RepID=UPI0008AB9B31|nr:HNH endonuclease family protein [Corynebacterium sp. HMSC074H12]OFQ58085.1 calcium-binding protein [Corynebacterium sp. HMSC074H12]